MRLVGPPCDTPSCGALATVTIEDHGELLSRHCGDCMALIELILETTSRIARSGVPRDVAANWAAAAVGKL